MQFKNHTIKTACFRQVSMWILGGTSERISCWGGQQGLLNPGEAPSHASPGVTTGLRGTTEVTPESSFLFLIQSMEIKVKYKAD